jgi:hypothetical protein
VYGSPTNGAKRIRTADPCNAIAVLYQLSYNPLSKPYLRAKVRISSS